MLTRLLCAYSFSLCECICNFIKMVEVCYVFLAFSAGLYTSVFPMLLIQFRVVFIVLLIFFFFFYFCFSRKVLDTAIVLNY